MIEVLVRDRETRTVEGITCASLEALCAVAAREVAAGHIVQGYHLPRTHLWFSAAALPGVCARVARRQEWDALAETLHESVHAWPALAAPDDVVALATAVGTAAERWAESADERRWAAGIGAVRYDERVVSVCARCDGVGTTLEDEDLCPACDGSGWGADPSEGWGENAAEAVREAIDAR